MDAPDKLWVVLDTRGHIVGTYRTPEEAGKAAGWGAHIVGYAHGMDEKSYARGWRDAVAAAVDAADAVEPVYPHDTQYCQLGDAVETKMAIVAAIAALEPPG